MKEFDHFENRSTFVDEAADKLLGNSLIMLKGQKWKNMRATLSPAFTGNTFRFNLTYQNVSDAGISSRIFR